MSIQQLPQGVIKLISSTQVISSISSVVKELLENSLDAGATVIDIKLERNGLDKIELRDNGCGISTSDINSVCLPHYTSKIHNFEDLEHLQSYGFRGEALHSLCSVSQISITTKTKADEVASTYTYDHNGTVRDINPSHQMAGTVVTVTNLFRNVPVRRQFYENSRKGTEELKKIEKIVKQLSIIHPKLRVTLAHNKCLIWHKTSVFSLRQSLMQVYPQAVLKNLEDDSCSLPNMSIEMLIAKRECNLSVLCQPVSEAILLYVNQRPVKDKKVEKVVLEEMNHMYASMLPINKCPLTLISLRLAPESLDVNLEPNKTKIFLKDHEEILKQIRERIMLHFYQQSTSDDLKALLLDTDELRNPSKKRKIENDTEISSTRIEDDSNDVSAMRNMIIEKTKVNAEEALKELADLNFSAFDENMSITSNNVDEGVTDQVQSKNVDSDEVPDEITPTPVSSKPRLESDNVIDLNKISCMDLFDDPLSLSSNHSYSVTKNLLINADTEECNNEISSNRSNEDYSKVLDNGDTILSKEQLPSITSEPVSGNDTLNETLSEVNKDISISQWSRGDVIIDDKPVEGPAILFQNRVEDSNSTVKEGEPQKTTKKSKTTFNKDDSQSIDMNRSVSSQMGRKDMAGFTNFAREVRSEIIKETPGITFTKVAGELAHRWRNLHEDQKNSFKKNALLKQKSIAADVKPMYKKKTVSLDVSINQILGALKIPGSLCHRLNENMVHVIGSVETSSEWLYKIGDDIKLVNVPHLQENVVFHRYICNHQIPLKPLEKPIKIAHEILGDDLLKFLLSLDRVSVNESNSSAVISDCRINSNGFKVLLTSSKEVLIIETVEDDGFDVIDNFLETLKLATRHKELEQCRSNSVRKILLNEVMKTCKIRLPPDGVAEIRMLLQYWIQCMKQKKLCTHDAPISVNLHSL